MIAFAEWCQPPESAALAKVLAAIEKAYGIEPPYQPEPVWPCSDTIIVRYTYPDGNTYEDPITIRPEDYSVGKKVLGILPDLRDGWKWRISPIVNGVVECVAVQGETG